MTDPRIAKWASVLVQYSLELKRGDLFIINTTPLAKPLALEVYREAVRAGAHPLMRLTFEEQNEIMTRYGSDEQLQYIPEAARVEVEQIAARLAIQATENTRLLSSADPQKVALQAKTSRALLGRILDRSAEGTLNWGVTLFPTNALAQEADMSLSDYTEFVYEACSLNDDDPVASWRARHDDQQRLVDYLQTKEQIHLVGPDTDLTYYPAKRPWINADGKRNFPDGEVFTSPDEHRTSGHIRYSFPALYAGREVTDVRLWFEDGKVVKATAERGEELLHQMLNVDEGARLLGEAAFGTNYNITRFSRNILFDEKIGGTVHLALGQAYPIAGGKNQSGVHWDMICDMRDGGESYADGQLFYKDGKFLV